jgi:hypothetical protein
MCAWRGKTYLALELETPPAMMTLPKVQETRAMAQNEKGGADLDIFEDLGKKPAPSRPTGRTVPPPPPSLRGTPDVGKRTLLGVTAPVGAMPASPGSEASEGNHSGTAAFPAPPPSPSRLPPPPPPGRGTLPPVMTPQAPKVATAQLPTLAAVANSVDVDWDDDDDEATQVFAEEATHIFSEDATNVLDDDDKTKAIPSAAALPIPAAGKPAPAAAPSRPKATLLGLTAPQALPPASRPPMRNTPPPPPPSRTSGFPGGGFPGSGLSGFSGSGFPPPPMNPFSAPPLPAPPTQKGLGGAAPPWSSLPPPPMPFMPGGTPTLPRPASAPDYGGNSQVRSMEATTMLPPNKVSPTGRYVVVGLAVGLAIVALGLALMPSKGDVVVNVNDSRNNPVSQIKVFVDGKKMECEIAPCAFEETAGSHEIKVLAEGFDPPAVQTVNIDAHKKNPVSFVVGSSRPTGLRVSGAQAGVKLFVDDKEIGPLPQDLHDLPPGDHVVRIAGSERYQPLEKHVTVEKDKVEDLGTVTLKVLKGKVTVAPGTQGARVYIVSGSDRRELPMLPISVDIDTTKSWALEASKPGFDDYRQLISFDDGQAEKAYTVTLEPKSTAAPQPVAQAPVYTPPAPQQAPAPRPAPPPQQSAPQNEGGGGEAFLNINSIPASNCFLDGKSLGSTPRMHVSVKAGSHTVKFVDADDGLTKTIFVTVGSGETKLAAAKLN